MNFLSQFIKRVGSDTPSFFKKILAGAVTLGGAGTAVIAVSAAIVLPPIVLTLAGYAVAVGAAAAVVAKSATTDPKLQVEGGSNVVVNKKEGIVDTLK